MRKLLNIILLVNVLLVIACNTEKNNSTNNPSNNTITSRLPAEPDMLNPLLTTNGYSKQVSNQIFSYLVQYDPASLEITPMLADALPIIQNIDSGEFAGGQSITFQIHKKAVWNNGTPVTAKDVVFTIKALLNPNVNAHRLRPFFEKIKKIEVDSENSKRFTVILEEYSFLINELFANLPILPEYHYDSSGLMQHFSIVELSDFEKAKQLTQKDNRLQKFAEAFHSPTFARESEGVIGSGPYELKQWISGQYIVLKKKDDWWGNQLATQSNLLKATPDEIIYKIIPDATTAMTSLKSGEIDAMNAFTPKQFDELQKNEFASTMLNFYSAPSMIYYYILMNRKNQILKDKKIRRALAHVLDVQEAIDIIMYGFAKKAVGPIYSSKKYFNEELQPIKWDLEKARKLLLEAGWKDSNNNGIVDKLIGNKRVELRLNYLINKGATGEAIGQLLKDKAKLVGIDIEIVIKEFVTKMKDIKKRDFDLSLMASGFDYDLDELKQMWHTSSDTPNGGNRSGFGNADSDKIIEEIESTKEEQNRNALYKEFQRIIYEDQPYIFLFSIQQNIAINKKWKGRAYAKRPGLFENLIDSK